MSNISEIDKIISSIRSNSNGISINSGIGGDLGVFKNNLNNKISDYTKPLDSGIVDFKYRVPISAVYDRQSNGNWIPKYENHIGAEGNEDRLSKEQGLGEKAIYGVGKFVGKTLTNAIDATVGFATGIIEASYKGDSRYLWDNSLSNTLDDLNKQMNYKLPHYYSNEEKSLGFLSKLGTSNFWFNEVGEGLAFVSGALLPEVVLGGVMSGKSLGVGLAKLNTKFGEKIIKESGEIIAERTLQKEALKSSEGIVGAFSRTSDKINDVIGFQKGADVIRSYNRAIYGKTAGDVVSTAGFLARSSGFEASMEARHNFHDAMDNFYNDFKEREGRTPTLDEIGKFTNDARTAANWVFGANMAILGVSNAAQFAKSFGYKVPSLSNTRLGNFANRAIGLSYETLDDGTKAMRKINRLQKVSGALYKTFRKPIIEGAYEEASQGIAGKVMQNYLDKKYSSDNNYAFDFWKEFTNASAKQYGTKDGWNEIGIGMVIGLLGGSFSKSGRKEMIESVTFSGRKNTQQEIESKLTRANEGIKLMRGMDRASSTRTFRNMSLNTDNDIQSTFNENTISNIEFLKSQEQTKSSRQVQKDFDAIVDNMTLDDIGLDELEQQGFDLDSYKSNLKSEFKQNVNDYKFAQRAVDALGIENNIPDTSVGNKELIKEAMVMNIALGKNSEKSARDVANQLNELLNLDRDSSMSDFDVFNFYNDISYNHWDKISQVKDKQEQIEKIRIKAQENRNQIIKLQSERKGNLRDKTLDKRYNSLAEKATLLQQEESKLNSEIENINEILKTDLRGSNLELSNNVNVDNFNVVTLLDRVKSIDNHVESLRKNGNDYQADSIEYLLDQFKRFSDHSREMKGMYSRMMTTDFFKSKEGLSLVNKTLGNKYEASPEFIEAIRQSESIIDSQLKMAGYRSGDTVLKTIQDSIDNNDDLSDREKYRLESLIRLSLNYLKNKNVATDIVKINSEFSNPVIEDDFSLEGDTVKIKEKISVTNNLDEINKAIESILKEIQGFRTNSSIKKDKIKKLEEKIELLEKQKTITERIEDTNVVDLKVGDTIVTSSGSVEKIKEITHNDKTVRIVTDNIDYDFDKSTQFNKYIKVRKKTQKQIDKINSIIESLNNDISNLKEENVNPLDKDDYKRYDYLIGKKESDGLTNDEQDELDLLEDDINDWLLLSGTVTQGVRLSDLIRQKKVLELTEVKKLENVSELSESEILEEVNFTDSQARLDFKNGQTYDSVFAVVSKNKNGDPVIKISNITIGGFKSQLPDGFNLKYEIDSNNGNIVITIDEAKRINNNTNIHIFAGETTFVANYSAVISFEEQLDGSFVGVPIKSDFTSENGEFENEQDIDAIYNSSVGDIVDFEINPNDSYNQTLITEYKKVANNKKVKPNELEEVKERLRKGLVIHAKIGNSYVSVMKSKRDNVIITDNVSNYFALRDEIVDGFIDSIELNNKNKGSKYTVPTNGTVSVQQILPGRPVFTYTKEGNKVSMKYSTPSKNDVSKIIDIGYIENNIVETKNKVGGIDFTFLNSTKNKNGKTPFIVIERGNKKVALPVKLKETSRPDFTEMNNILKDKGVSDIDKAIKLNKILAGFGIDITVPGNAFFAVGDETNVTRAFYNEKIKQINNNSYFSPLETWKSKKVNMSDVITNQILINYNLSEPLHSPKLKFNFDDVFLNVKGSIVSNKKSTNNKKLNNSTAQSALNKLKKCP